MIVEHRGCVGFEWLSKLPLPATHAVCEWRCRLVGDRAKIQATPTLSVTLPPPGGSHCFLVQLQRPAAGPWSSQSLVPPLSRQLRWALTPPCNSKRQLGVRSEGWEKISFGSGSLPVWLGLGARWLASKSVWPYHFSPGHKLVIFACPCVIFFCILWSCFQVLKSCTYGSNDSFLKLKKCQYWTLVTICTWHIIWTYKTL